MVSLVSVIIFVEYLIISLISVKYINWNQLNENLLIKKFSYYIFILVDFLILTIWFPSEYIFRPNTNLIFLSYINYILVYIYIILNLIIYFNVHYNHNIDLLNIIRNILFNVCSITALFIFIFICLIFEVPNSIDNLTLHLNPLLIMIFDLLWNNNEIFIGNFYLSLNYLNLYMIYIFLLIQLSLISYPYPYYIFYLTSNQFLLFYQYMLLGLITCCLLIYLLGVLKKFIINIITKYFQNNSHQYVSMFIEPTINYGTCCVNSSEYQVINI